MQLVKNVASSHKTNLLEFILYNLSLEGHQNCCIGSKVTSILLNGWILPTVHQEGYAPAAFAAVFLLLYIAHYIHALHIERTFLQFQFFVHDIIPL